MVKIALVTAIIPESNVAVKNATTGLPVFPTGTLVLFGMKIPNDIFDVNRPSEGGFPFFG